MPSYELLGLSQEKLELTNLTQGKDFFSVNDFRHIFLTASIALQEIKRLKIEDSVKIKRYPFDLQMVPSREEYMGEEISYQALQKDVQNA